MTAMQHRVLCHGKEGKKCTWTGNPEIPRFGFFVFFRFRSARDVVFGLFRVEWCSYLLSNASRALLSTTVEVDSTRNFLRAQLA
jgi:hypothetical protein